MATDTITIEGPFNAVRPTDSPSRREIFVCRPTGAQDEEGCAKKILSTLARRAYRRPVTDRDVEALLGLYRNGRRDGDFETGIQLALEGLLVSPNFLLRVERDPANRHGGDAVSHQRPRTGVPSLVFPLEQSPRRHAAGRPPRAAS